MTTPKPQAKDWIREKAEEIVSKITEEYGDEVFIGTQYAAGEDLRKSIQSALRDAVQKERERCTPLVLSTRRLLEFLKKPMDLRAESDLQDIIVGINIALKDGDPKCAPPTE